MPLDNKMRILLAEDAKAMRRMEVKILAEAGFPNVVQAVDGRDAADKLEAGEQIDLVISDWSMPNMDGLQLVQWLRSREEFKKLPILMATSHGDKGYVAEIMAAGADGVLTKPFNADELKSAMAKVLGQEDPAAAAKAQAASGPRQSEDGRLLLRMAHIQITDHLALGVLKERVESAHETPIHFALETSCLGGWNPLQAALESGEVDGALILAPMAMDMFSYQVPIKLVLFAHRNGSICVRKRRKGQRVTPAQFYRDKSFYIPHKMSIHNLLAHEYFEQQGLKAGVANEPGINLLLEVVPPVAMPEVLRDNPEAVAEFTRMMIRAGRSIPADLEGSAQVAVRFLDPQGKLGLKPELLRGVLADPAGIVYDDLYEEDYGIEIRFVTEIIGIQNITRVPDMPPFLKGVINLRGKVIPVMDVRARFKLLERDYDERTCIISELAFTLYAAVTDIFNLLGHIYKVVAYLFLYRAVFISTVQTPYQQLRKMGDELLEAKENWERTFSSIGDMVIIQDPQRRIIMANRRVAQVTGLEMAELIGKHCHEAFHASSQPCPGCPISDVDELEKVGAEKGAEGDSGPPGNHRAEIFHEHLGINCAVSSAPVYGPDGKLIQIITISQDITRLKTLEGQLRQAQKMEAIGTLAGGIAHDFNNILTPILGYSDLLVKELTPESPMQGPAREIHQAGLRARDLVRQILSFSRQAKQQRQPITIALIVKEALKLLRSSLPTTIEIRQDIAPGGDGKVLADPTSIHQVIMNLCTNAHHAMKEHGGVLAVSIKEVEVGPGDFAPELGVKTGPYLRLAVADTGCGMPPEVMERLFDPYFTTKPTGEGTGLGLPVVHGIVKDLGGQIKVYSEVGKGTNFIILLPRYQGEENGQAAAAAAVDQPLPRGDERILVVDDEKPISDLLLSYLGELGYRVTTSNDPVQALELFSAAPDNFDLVISDVTMPRLNGIELAQKLLAVKPRLAIILCTGFSEAINQEKANAAGVRRLLMKPVLGQELAQAVREVLDQERR